MTETITILHLTTAECGARFLEEIGKKPEYKVRKSGITEYIVTSLGAGEPDHGSAVKRRYRLTIAHSLPEATFLLRSFYFHVLSIDMQAEHKSWVCESSPQNLDEIIDALYAEGAEADHLVKRIVAIISDDDALHRALAIGRHRLDGLVLNPEEGNNYFGEIDRIIKPAETAPKTALCLAGGGVEGMLWELGVLRALNSFFGDRKVTDFDMYFGISGGAYIAALLANGINPEELIRAFEHESTVLEPLTSKIIYDLNYPEFYYRLRSLLWQLPQTKTYAQLVSTIIKSIPGGLCRGDKLEEYVCRQFERNHVANDFRSIRRKLYVGATDQDTTEHVLFGSPGHDDVPISSAVRASSALVPFYHAKEIKGRYFVDGAYSRTTNFEAAIQMGAKLVIILDPLVPLVVKETGYVNERGGVFGAIQGIKAMSHSRFIRAFNFAIREYRDVVFMLFRPESVDMRVMSGSPMKYTIRMEIERLGFNAAKEKIERNVARVRATFQEFGFQLNETQLEQEYQQLQSCTLDEIKTIMEGCSHRNARLCQIHESLGVLDDYLECHFEVPSKV